MKKRYAIWGVLFCSVCLMLASCEEKGLLVSSNDTAYLKFVNDMTKDTTTVSFKMPQGVRLKEAYRLLW